MSELLIFGLDAQESLKKGVKKLTDAVGTTMGPQGNLVLIERNGEPPHLTKDGATVAKNAVLTDRVEALGAQLLKQASENTATVAGDGSTTATVLSAEIYFKASQALRSGIASPTEMTRLLKTKSDEIISLLKKETKKVESDEEIKQVATISANGDDYIGELISSAMKEVGSSGLVTVEKGGGTDTVLNLARGVKIDRGFISPYFVNTEDKSKCTLENPYVLILEDKLSSLTQILPVLEMAYESKKEMLIIAPDFDPEATQSLVTNVSRGLLNVCAIKSPFYGDKRNTIMSDLSKALGTKIYSPDEKVTKQIFLSDLGQCKKIEVTHDSTLFVECQDIQDSEDLTNNIEELLKKKDISREEEYFLKQRLAVNKGVVAVLTVGAHTESELLELVDRIDDALHATKAAIESGFLPGGGIALAKAGLKLQSDANNSSSLIDKNVTKIMSDACLAPLRQILKNADLPVDYIFEMIKNSPDWDYGYNVRENKYVNMIEAGIIDPYKVTTTALMNATSAACNLISVGCVVLSGSSMQQDVQLLQLTEDMY
jgi:chaperonin GroEL